MRASTESEISTLKSSTRPPSTSSSTPVILRLTSVVKRSRGTNTRQEKKRPKGSRRISRRTRWRSCSCKMPIAISNSSSSLIWNNSSRG